MEYSVFPSTIGLGEIAGRGGGSPAGGGVSLSYRWQICQFHICWWLRILPPPPPPHPVFLHSRWLLVQMGPWAWAEWPRFLRDFCSSWDRSTSGRSLEERQEGKGWSSTEAASRPALRLCLGLGELLKKEGRRWIALLVTPTYSSGS